MGRSPLSATRGLDPRGHHLLRKDVLPSGWIAGSSPAMTGVNPSPAPPGVDRGYFCLLRVFAKRMDCRVKPGNDDGGSSPEMTTADGVKPGNDELRAYWAISS